MALSLSRRRFLESVGLAGAATVLPFHRGILHADGPAVPKRFVGLKYCNGIQPNLWYPEGSGDDFILGELPRLLAPFESVKSKINVLRRLKLAASIGPGGSHNAGMVTFLTGTEREVKGISLDQHLADQFGGSTSFPSIQLGTGRMRAPEKSISFRSGATALRPDIDPYQSYERIFAPLAESGSSDELERLRAEERSVLDHVATDLRDLSAQLGADDRRKLEFHLESLRDMERRLSTSAGSCDAPTAPGSRLDPEDDANLPVISRLNMDIITNALACRLTHFVTLTFSAGAGAFTFPWLGTDVTMHSLSHYKSDPDVRQEAHVKALEWHFQEVAYLLERLDAISEEDGGTLLDHSAVLLGTDNGESHGHEIKNIPFVLAGSAGGAFRTGRCITYPAETPHNDLLVTLANVFGDPIETFGQPQYCTGPLPGLS